MFGTLFFLLFIGAIALYFAEALKAREAAVVAARRACEREGLLFLDDSVAQRRMRISRDRQGRLGLERTFAFEYSDTGNNRLPGWIVANGQQIVEISTVLRAPVE
jgi:hypothetical protein